MTLKFLPPANFSQGTLANPRALNNANSSKQIQQKMLIADNAILPIIYGEVVCGAKILDYMVYQGKLVIVAFWAMGQCDSIVQVYIDNVPITSAVTHYGYTGTQSQTVNSFLAAAYAAQSPAYTHQNAFPGVCHSILAIPLSLSSGVPEVTAKIRGLLVYDPRDGTQSIGDRSTWKFSKCPALHIADACSDTTGYGAACSVDWASVTALANENDTLVGGEKRRESGIMFDKPQDFWTTTIEVLRAHAGCFVNRIGGLVEFTPNRPVVSADATYDHSSGNIRALTDLSYRPVEQSFNAVELFYTDTTTVPWSTKSYIAYGPGVAQGSVDYKPTSIRMEGVQRRSQAIREAREWVNYYLQCDLSFSLELYDEALALKVGSVIDVTYPLGLVSKRVRVVQTINRYGWHWVRCEEYSDNMYSDEVTTDSGWPDTTLPNSYEPTAPQSLSVVEEAFQMDNGLWSSRLRATWVNDYVYLDKYVVEVYDGPELVFTGTAEEGAWVSPSVTAGKFYLLRVRTRSVSKALSGWSSSGVDAVGKGLIPTDVTGFGGVEVGGEVRLHWNQSADVDTLRYEVRYGATSVAWSAASTIDIVDSLRLVTRDIVPGTYDFLVKAVDSIGQYSATEARISITVTSDANVFFGGYKEFSSPTLSNMAEYPVIPGDSTRYFVTEDGVLAATKFPSTASTYGNIAATYHSSITSSFTTESKDFGSTITGNWTTTHTEQAVSGSVAAELRISIDNWTTYSAFTSMVGKATGRYARQYYEALTTSTLKVSIGVISVRCDAVGQPEGNTDPLTSSASASTLIQFSRPYIALVEAPKIIPIGSGSYVGVADRILVAPDFGLMFQSVVDSGSGNAYIYQTLYDYAAGSRTIISGDYLEYDVYLVKTAQASNYSIGGITLYFSDATYSNDASCSDQYGVAMEAWGYPTTSKTVWFSRKISLAPKLGKLIKKVLILNESDTTGTYEVVVKNVRITDGAGTTRASYYATSGEPQANAAQLTARQAQVQMGPANSMLANVFLSNTGARTAQKFYWSIRGIG